MNNNMILHTEYAAFRKNGVLEFFEKELQSKKYLKIYDPMAGTAPLIPLIEYGGHKAYFNDIFPLHYFTNKAKTYNSFQIFKKMGIGRLNQILKELRWTPSLGQDRGYIKSGSRCPKGIRC